MGRGEEGERNKWGDQDARVRLGARAPADNRTNMQQCRELRPYGRGPSEKTDSEEVQVDGTRQEQDRNKSSSAGSAADEEDEDTRPEPDSRTLEVGNGRSRKRTSEWTPE